MKQFLAALLASAVYADQISQIEAQPLNIKQELGSEEEPKTMISGSEQMGIGSFAGDVNFDNLFSRGLCPQVNAKKNIEFQRLTGDWFLQRTDEPSVPELLPTCHHANFQVNADGSFLANEEVRIEGKNFLAEAITGRFNDSVVEAELFGAKLRVQMELLDTDYDNFLIGYQCYDNMQFAID